MALVSVVLHKHGMAESGVRVGQHNGLLHWIVQRSGMLDFLACKKVHLQDASVAVGSDGDTDVKLRLTYERIQHVQVLTDNDANRWRMC